MSLPEVRIEKRLKQRRWLMVVVPLGSLIVAHIAIAILLVTTGHSPVTTFHRLVDAAYLSSAALTNTLIAARPVKASSTSARSVPPGWRCSCTTLRRQC